MYCSRLKYINNYCENGNKTPNSKLLNLFII